MRLVAYSQRVDDVRVPSCQQQAIEWHGGSAAAAATVTPSASRHATRTVSGD